MATIAIGSNETPHIVDYRLRHGRTIDPTWAVQVDEVAKDLSNCTVTFTVEKDDGTSEIAARAITPGGGSNNEIQLLITATDTAAWEGVYLYEINCVFPNGDSTHPSGATKCLVAGTIEATNPI